jgi:hypothetical protein
VNSADATVTAIPSGACTATVYVASTSATLISRRVK